MPFCCFFNIMVVICIKSTLENPLENVSIFTCKADHFKEFKWRNPVFNIFLDSSQFLIFFVIIIIEEPSFLLILFFSSVWIAFFSISCKSELRTKFLSVFLYLKMSYFDQDCGESVDWFGEYCILMILCLPIKEHGVCFHFLRFSLISFNIAL